MSGRNMKGKHNPRYLDGRSVVLHLCRICHVNKISYNNWLSGKRTCQKCYYKTLTSSGNPNYKLGNTHNNKCIDCGKHISKNALRCKVCAGKQTSTRQLGKNNPMYGKLPSHGKHFKYKKCNFRSSWELAYAKYLDKNHIKWEYEPRTFKINNMTYTPDFYLPNSDTWIEIKGYWRDDAIKKFIMIKKLYKSMKIVLLTGKTLKEKGII